MQDLINSISGFSVEICDNPIRTFRHFPISYIGFIMNHVVIVKSDINNLKTFVEKTMFYNVLVFFIESNQNKACYSKYH